MAVFPFNQKHPRTLKRFTSSVNNRVAYSVENVHRSSTGVALVDFVAYPSCHSNIVVAPKWSNDMGSCFTRKGISRSLRAESHFTVK